MDEVSEQGYDNRTNIMDSQLPIDSPLQDYPTLTHFEHNLLNSVILMNSF